jgi:BirA family biotin operon repressor/biotin-[acetyl-CoA-carboxylase] ligase
LSAPEAGAPLFGRRERFRRVESTNDVVRTWLAAGDREVCVAVADEQTSGRGRDGRAWHGPPNDALLLSLGFRPAWLAPDRTWRLAAVVSLGMADAAERVAGLDPGSVRLKWPNDLVSIDGGPADPRRGTLRKLAGVLGETDGLGTADPRVVIGIGINAGWRPAAFPTELAATMTSLHELSGGVAVDAGVLLDAFLVTVEPAILALRRGQFDVDAWSSRQVTTGHEIAVETPDGSVTRALTLGVDTETGGLVLADPFGREGERIIHSGEIRHVRLATPEATSSAGLAGALV